MLREGTWLGWVVLISSATSLAAADSPEELFGRFNDQVRQDLTQVVNYTCLETIHRAERQPRSQAFQHMDTLRLEVSKVGGKELFAWPGARQFEDRDIGSFVSGGTTSTGLFEMTAHELFVSGAGEFKYHGEESLNGRRTIRYDYTLPPDHGYAVHIRNGASAQVGVQGSFWFNPDSLDLVRIQGHSTNPPAGIGFKEMSVSVDYARVPVGETNALLPRTAEMYAAFSDVASRNTTEFSQCHEYQTQSSISFEPPAASIAETPKPPVIDVRLPPGLLVPVVLETAIDSKTTAIGDAVRARVREDVRRDGGVVLPVGAVIQGRVRRLERRNTAGESYFMVAVEFLEAEWGSSHADFYGELVEAQTKKGVTAGYAVRGRLTCMVQGKTVHIDPGLTFLWRVLERPARP